MPSPAAADPAGLRLGVAAGYAGRYDGALPLQHGPWLSLDISVPAWPLRVAVRGLSTWPSDLRSPEADLRLRRSALWLGAGVPLRLAPGLRALPVLRVGLQWQARRTTRTGPGLQPSPESHTRFVLLGVLAQLEYRLFGAGAARVWLVAGAGVEYAPTPQHLQWQTADGALRRRLAQVQPTMRLGLRVGVF